MADWKRGDQVQRKGRGDGAKPVSLFRGTICGEYVNPANDQPGYAVSLNHDPGVIQIFPTYMLELVAEEKKLELVVKKPFSERMNTQEPFRKLGKDHDPDYCLQNGTIYNWSESNLGYEHAWWLTCEGDPINNSEHVANLLKDRPFDKAWLEGLK